MKKVSSNDLKSISNKKDLGFNSSGSESNSLNVSLQSSDSENSD